MHIKSCKSSTLRFNVKLLYLFELIPQCNIKLVESLNRLNSKIIKSESHQHHMHTDIRKKIYVSLEMN